MHELFVLALHNVLGANVGHECNYCTCTCYAELHVQAAGLCLLANLGDCCVRLTGVSSAAVSSLGKCYICICPSGKTEKHGISICALSLQHNFCCLA